MKINSSLPGETSLADTAASKSIIRHPKLPLVILRTEYLAIAKGNHCAAKLLAVFENWTNWFVRQGKSERWVRLNTEAIHQHLLGEHKKVAIQKAIALLLNLGFIRHEQRRKHRHDRSWFYWFEIEKVQDAIDALELPAVASTEEDYLRIDAELEPENRVVIDTLSTANQQLLKVTNDTLSTANRDAVNSQSICHSTANRDAVNSQSLNRYSNRDLNTTINSGAAAEKKLFDEEEEKEASQGADDSGTLQEPLEPTGILEEPLDPITQAQQATVQLLDERAVFDDLRRLGIELNEGVRATMRKYKENVPDAIAHIKQRYNNRHERFKNITGAFVKACTEGAKPRPTTRTQVNPPSIEQMCQLEEAKATRVIRDFYLAPTGSDREVIMVDTGSGMMAWWEYLA